MTDAGFRHDTPEIAAVCPICNVERARIKAAREKRDAEIKAEEYKHFCDEQQQQHALQHALQGQQHFALAAADLRRMLKL